MSDTKTAVDPRTKINPATVELAAKLRKEHKFDTKTGDGTVTEGSYITHAVEHGLDEDVLKKVSSFNTLYTNATALAVADEGAKLFPKHAGLEALNLSIPTVGKDTIDANLRRQIMVPDRSKGADPAARVPKHGVLTMTHNVYSNGNRGDFGRIRDIATATISEALSKA